MALLHYSVRNVAVKGSVFRFVRGRQEVRMFEQRTNILAEAVADFPNMFR
jgi:hypothetical protein